MLGEFSSGRVTDEEVWWTLCANLPANVYRLPLEPFLRFERGPCIVSTSKMLLPCRSRVKDRDPLLSPPTLDDAQFNRAAVEDGSAFEVSLSTASLLLQYDNFDIDGACLLVLVMRRFVLCS